MNFTSKLIIRALDQLVFTVIVMFFFLASFENLSTFISTFKKFIGTHVIMIVNILKNDLCAAPMIFASFFSVLAFTSMMLHFMSFKPHITSILENMSTSFVWAFNHFVRTIILDMILHISSFYLFFTSISTLDKCFWAVFDYMSIHFI